MSKPRPRLVREELKQVVVIGSRYKPAGQDVARAVVTWLERAGIEVIPDIDGDQDLSRVARGADLAISVGGDGTMLSTARRLGPAQVPTMGVNLGKLGFLAEFTEVEVRDWIAGRKELDLGVAKRMRLRCQVIGPDKHPPVYALNDAVVSQGVLTRLITIDMRVDEHRATRYRVDGLVICSPVGSTAYSLSLGGPIVTPGMKAFIVTPIAPHSLTNRPIIVTGDHKLRFRLETPVREAALVIDGHEAIPIAEGSEFEVRRARRDFLVVTPNERSYYYLLRTKLGWGENPGYQQDGDV